jgi:hypothetical protein
LSGLGRAPTYGGVSTVLADGRIHITGWDGTKSQGMEYNSDGKNGFDRLDHASAPLRAASVPATSRPEEGTLNYFAQGESVGPDAPQMTPMHANANPSVNEGSDYGMPLSMGDGWTIKWDQNDVSTDFVPGHPATAPHPYPDGPATHTITATSKSIYLQGTESFTPATTTQVVEADALTLAAGTTLDVNDNDLIVNSGNFSTIQASVFEGYSGGPDTTKTGIVSTASQSVGGSTILALFDNALAGISDWPQGSGLTLDPNAIVGKYTYLGDTNMDGMVAPQDYTAVDSNLGTTGLDPGIEWFYGDTNFDTDVTPQDYTAIDSALGLGVGNPLTVSGRYDSPVRLSQDVDVNNVTPTVSINAPATAVEGEPLFLTAGLFDPGWDDTQTYQWTVTKNGSTFASGTQDYLELTPEGVGSYQVAVTAIDDDGASSSDSVTLNVGLSAPTDVKIVPGSESARVMWSDANTDESGFDLQWSIDGVNWSSDGVAPVNQNARGNHLITGLNPGTQYQIRVRATAGDITSGWSEVQSVATLDPGIPMKPTSVTASATSDPQEATLTWDDDPEATGGFEVQIFDSYAQDWQDLGSAPAGSQSLTVSDLVSGNDNALRVVALGGLNGGASRATLASENPGDPSSPSDPVDVETPYGDGLVTLWQPYFQHHNILSFDRSSADFSEDGELSVQHSNDGFTLDLSDLPAHYGLPCISIYTAPAAAPSRRRLMARTIPSRFTRATTNYCSSRTRISTRRISASWEVVSMEADGKPCSLSECAAISYWRQRH